jgi:hypothetical protein
MLSDLVVFMSDDQQRSGAIRRGGARLRVQDKYRRQKQGRLAAGLSASPKKQACALATSLTTPLFGTEFC